MTSSSQLSPFLIEPRFVTRVWGYKSLRPWYDVDAEGDPIGEVWLTGDDCRIATGPHTGRSLIDVFNEFPRQMLGAAAPRAESPLLIKMLFAREKLSVQVHPDDAMAQKYGAERGKTECWYAISAEPGAQVACGLKAGVTIDQVRAGIDDGTLEQSLAIIPIATDDMIFVDAGTVHAIHPGSVLLETQQNCDITYRMFDYGRPRELHIDRSIEATKLHTRAGKFPQKQLDDRTVLIDVEYFRIERVPVDGDICSDDLRGISAAGLSYLFAADGSARIHNGSFEDFEIPTRGIACIPSDCTHFEVDDLGELDLIRITPNWPTK